MNYTKIKGLIESVLDESKASYSSKEHYHFNNGRAPTGHGTWMFSSKHPLNFNIDNDRVFHNTGTFGDAQKAASAHYKSNGHKGEFHVLP